MKRYIALLRGINISGKNKVPMTVLKDGCRELGYSDIKTYLNSGNVIFTAAEENMKEDRIAEMIQAMIERRTGLDIPVFVIGQDELENLLSLAPDWWGTEQEAIYDNLIFLLYPYTAEVLAEKIGAPSDNLEQIQIVNNAVFWSFDRKNYAKANWWKKTASAGIGEMITVRTANTLRKIVRM
jgi:uncharacterized protein (DUF1697 family)